MGNACKIRFLWRALGVCSLRRTHHDATLRGLRFIYYSSEEGTPLANIFRLPVNGGDPYRLPCTMAMRGAICSPDTTKSIFESSAGDPDGSAGTKLVQVAL